MRGSEGWKSPSRVQRQLPGGSLAAKPPEADNIFSKWCINISSSEVLDNICSRKKHFNISRGKVTLAHACGCPCLWSQRGWDPVCRFQRWSHVHGWITSSWDSGRTGSTSPLQPLQWLFYVIQGRSDLCRSVGLICSSLLRCFRTVPLFVTDMPKWWRRL